MDINNMFNSIYQSIIILTTIMVYYVFDFLLISYYDQQRQAKGSGRHWNSTIKFMLIAGFIVVQPIWWPWLGLQTDAWWGAFVQTIGMVFLLGALTLHWWARLHLRHFYAQRTELQPNHYIVNTGPYAYVRHPIFTSYFILTIGLFLVNLALPTLLLIIYIFWNFSRVAKREEILFSKNLLGYAEYMTRTGRFLPNFYSQKKAS